MNSVEAAISAIFRKHKSAGLYTHALAAHGRLDDPSHDFLFSDLPDGRAIFDLASLTKALVTTPLLFHRRSINNFSFMDTVGEWLGEEAADLRPELRSLTVRSLMRHESGLPAWRNWWVCHTPLVEGLNRAAEALDSKQLQVYSDVGFLLLGLVLERLGGRSLADQFADLALDSFGFDCVRERFHYATRLPQLAETAISTGYCAVRERVLVGEVHDENCWSLGGETAHSGVFGSGPALVAFLRTFAASALGQQVLRENAGARVLPPGDPPNQPCLGWRQGADRSSLGFHDGKAMGHMGFTGTAFWIYPEAREYAILLTNRIVSARVNPAISDMRREIFTVFGQRG